MIGPYHLLAQSRTRFCVPETMRKGGDNHGFGAWVQGHMVELAKLGPGVHYGEWWGHGIQRKYGLDHKRFSLFNVTRWAHNPNRPECCHVVPILALGKPEDGVVESAIDQLRRLGSQAAPGFMDPECVIVFHSAANKYFKVMLKNDDEPKSLSYEKLLAFQRGQIECA
jgi:hypothetical protein